MEAIKVLRPYFNPLTSSPAEEMDWSHTEKSVCSSQILRDSKDVKAVLMAISKAYPVRATNTVVITLKEKSNHVLKAEVEKLTRPKLK